MIVTFRDQKYNNPPRRTSIRTHQTILHIFYNYLCKKIYLLLFQHDLNKAVQSRLLRYTVDEAPSPCPCTAHAAHIRLQGCHDTSDGGRLTARGHALLHLPVAADTRPHMVHVSWRRRRDHGRIMIMQSHAHTLLLLQPNEYGSIYLQQWGTTGLGLLHIIFLPKKR